MKRISRVLATGTLLNQRLLLAMPSTFFQTGQLAVFRTDWEAAQTPPPNVANSLADEVSAAFDEHGRWIVSNMVDVEEPNSDLVVLSPRLKVAGSRIEELGISASASGPGGMSSKSSALVGSNKRHRPSAQFGKLFFMNQRKVDPMQNDKIAAEISTASKLEGALIELSSLYICEPARKLINSSSRGELRKVTIVFAKAGFVDRFLDEFAGLTLAQEACNIFLEAAVDFEGTLIDFIADEKGVCAILAFGLPPST
jgi:hypothetical protein